jgi:NAD(P)-dependent dehydrogenase (short-subunit alcohol dehydrogenase family)
MAKSKTVLITGAALRLGREIALSFADNGWDVVIHTHRSKKAADELAALIEQKKRKATVVQADLTDAQAVSRIIPALSRRGVALDCLVNNAAQFNKDSLHNLTPESWRQHMDVNLFAPLQLIRDFAAQYKGASGNIINITDGMHGWSLSPTFLSYSLSKLSLNNATQLLVCELAPRIRINAIAPGPTLEGMQDKKNTFAKLKKIIPLARTSSPSEVCDAVHYILSASSLTGQIISLSGGM